VARAKSCTGRCTIDVGSRRLAGRDCQRPGEICSTESTNLAIHLIGVRHAWGIIAHLRCVKFLDRRSPMGNYPASEMRNNSLLHLVERRWTPGALIACASRGTDPARPWCLCRFRGRLLRQRYSASPSGSHVIFIRRRTCHRRPRSSRPTPDGDCSSVDAVISAPPAYA